MTRAKSFESPTFEDTRDAVTLLDWAMPQMADVLERAGSNDSDIYCIVCADPDSPILHSAIRNACLADVSPTEKAWLLLLPMVTVKQILLDTHRDHGACAVACSMSLDKSTDRNSMRVVVFTDKAVVPLAISMPTCRAHADSHRTNNQLLN